MTMLKMKAETVSLLSKFVSPEKLGAVVSRLETAATHFAENGAFSFTETFFCDSHMVTILFKNKHFVCLNNSEYDPSKWNNFPEVTPPDGVPMRVELKVNGSKKGYLSVY